MMGWDGPLLTDSGGFQVMSLGNLGKIAEDGVTFKSHLDGSKHRLTPERSTEIQHLLDATITMAFDECTPFPATEAVAADSMRLSMRWAARSREAFGDRPGHALSRPSGGRYRHWRPVDREGGRGSPLPVSQGEGSCFFHVVR